MHQGIRGNMLHLQYKHNRLCLFGILREGKSKYSYITLTYCPLGTDRDNSSSSHDVSRSSHAQMSGRALCDICASAPVSERTRVILRESMGWGSRVVDVCITRPYLLPPAVFFWEGVGQLRFTWPLHRFPWYVLELQGHRGVIYGRCQMNAVPHAGVNTVPPHPTPACLCGSWGITSRKTFTGN